jgi:hypothetical protein
VDDTESCPRGPERYHDRQDDKPETRQQFVYAAYLIWLRATARKRSCFFPQEEGRVFLLKWGSCKKSLTNRLIRGDACEDFSIGPARMQGESTCLIEPN